jgi:mannose-6-phosphate isomerase-like protein (cupin superfamily)
MGKDIKDCVVPKPWGYEYLFFENQKLGIWFLNINGKQKTSLHCHPNKKTGLIVLNGKANLSFLTGHRLLSSLNKTMIFKGVFHSTKALSKNGVQLLEVECPKNKKDLIRIDDSYGRQDKGYEHPDQWVKRDNSHFWFPNKVNNELKFNGFRFYTTTLTHELLKHSLRKDDIVISLRKNVVITEYNNPVCRVGDVLMVSILRKLVRQFKINPDNMVMCIQKDK